MRKAICFARSFLVCMRYWTLKIYYCLISLTPSQLFVVSILFLILNFFSHCLSVVVSLPKLYLTSHGQCSGLWSLVTCFGCWWGVVKWQSMCWIGLLFGEHKAHRMSSYHSGTHRCHNHRHHYHHDVINIIIRIPRAPRRIRSARVADRYNGGTSRSPVPCPVFALLWFFLMKFSHVIPRIYSFGTQW